MSKPVEGGAVKVHSALKQVELVVSSLVSASISSQDVSVAVHSVRISLAIDRKRWGLVVFVEIPLICSAVLTEPIETKNK